MNRFDTTTLFVIRLFNNNDRLNWYSTKWYVFAVSDLRQNSMYIFVLTIYDALLFLYADVLLRYNTKVRGRFFDTIESYFDILFRCDRTFV